MTSAFPEAINVILILVMLFGVILVGVGVFRTRSLYRRGIAELQSEIQKLRADIEDLKKG
jgi:hypothetical protein